jgi:predicted metal-dependent hydrolase
MPPETLAVPRISYNSFDHPMFHFYKKPVEKIVSSRSTTLSGKNYLYTLVQSSGARTVRLKISIDKGLEIIVPRRFHLDHLDQIVAKHEQWILKQMNKFEARKKLHQEHELRHGSELTILGEKYTVKIISGAQKKLSVKRVQQLVFEEQRAIVEGYALHVHCDGTVQKAKKALEEYLRGIAEKYFNKRVAEMAEQMNVHYKKITIRGQKTRWGSCTREKSLNFNWRLIMLPLPVAESVIIHELAHTLHMNHSKAFYSFVESFCPDYRKLQKYLRNPQFLV